MKKSQSSNLNTRRSNKKTRNSKRINKIKVSKKKIETKIKKMKIILPDLQVKQLIKQRKRKRYMCKMY